MPQLSFETGSEPLDEETLAAMLADQIAAQGRHSETIPREVADVIAAQGRDPETIPRTEIDPILGRLYIELGLSYDRVRYEPPEEIIGEFATTRNVVVHFPELEAEAPDLELAS